MTDLSHLKFTPYPGVPNVEEVEQSTGQRCLMPTKEWSAAIASTSQGDALHALYMILGLLGVPAHVILTIAAVRVADADKKINFETWITTRSNWSEEDKTGAIHVLKTVDMKVGDAKNAKSGALFGEELPKLPDEKKPEDDWNLN